MMKRKLKNGDIRLILVYKHKDGVLVTAFSKLYLANGQVINGNGKVSDE